MFPYYHCREDIEDTGDNVESGPSEAAGDHGGMGTSESGGEVVALREWPGRGRSGRRHAETVVLEDSDDTYQEPTEAATPLTFLARLDRLHVWVNGLVN